VLYHDGVHGLVAHGNRANDFIVNSFVGVPLLLPIHMYRALHQSHHLRLGHAEDPERVLLYRGQPWEYRPLGSRSLALQLIGDMTSWNGVIMVIRYFRELRPGGALRLPNTRWFPELPAQFLLFFAALTTAFLLHPSATARILLLWYLPYLTLTQLLQKIRSFAEHATPAEPVPPASSAFPDNAPGLSCSWSPGILGRLAIWPYNINYHREHHARADIPWDRLPAAFPAAVQRPGIDLIHHLWKRESV
jgi:fatty acid desaturase